MLAHKTKELLTHEEASFLLDLSVATSLSVANFVAWGLKQLGSKAAANILALVGKATPPVGLIGTALAVADAWYGFKGVDITIGVSKIAGMAYIGIGAPTVDRQHGEYYDPGVKKWLNLARGNGAAPTRTLVTDTPENRQLCSYGYSDANGPVFGPC